MLTGPVRAHVIEAARHDHMAAQRAASRASADIRNTAGARGAMRCENVRLLDLDLRRRAGYSGLGKRAGNDRSA